MRHLLKHMFAVRIVILMIFCAIFTINENPMANAAAAAATSPASGVELTREMHDDGDRNEFVTTADALQLKFDTTSDASSEKTLRTLPIVLQRVEKSFVALNGTILDNEPT